MRIGIIGGGIAGLAAAYELEKARTAGASVDYTLYEARTQLGGSLASEIVQGAVLERGPDSFLTEKPAAAELCRELGLGAELIPSNDVARKTHIIVVRNRLVSSARWVDVPGAHQASFLRPRSRGSSAFPQSCAWQWSCCTLRVLRTETPTSTSRSLRSSDGTSVRRPSTASPIRS